MISNLHNQLAEHKHSITWYEEELRRYLEQAERARRGAAWHRERMQQINAEIAALENLMESVQQMLEAEDSEEP